MLAAVALGMVYNTCSGGKAAAAFSETENSAASAVVLYADGRCAYEKNADEPRLIASTTKLMTALLAIELSEPDTRITVPAACCGIEGSSMYLRPGEEYSADELLTGLLLASGNDAAMALAVGLCGSEEAFVARMNDRAAQLGLEHTSFANPHGLDAEGHFSTARDLARLMLRCMENERLARLIAQRSCRIGENWFVNHNKLMDRLDGCLGGKTGYTRAAGRCLVSCCERDGLRFVCVTLSDPDDWNDHVRLYEEAFANWGRSVIVSRDERYEIALVKGERAVAVAAPERELELVLPSGEEPELVREMPQFTFAPVRRGECAGRIVVLVGGEAVAEIRLIYLQDVAESK